VPINLSRRNLIVGAPLAAAASSIFIALPAKAQAVGQPLKLFPAAMLNGEMFDPKVLQDHVVLLYIWASWCPYCLRDISALRDKQEQHADKKFAVLGINIDTNPDSAEKWIKTYKVNFRSLRATADYKTAYGNNGRVSTPSWWLTGRDSIVVDSSIDDGAQFVYRNRTEAIDKLVAKPTA
jgi:thiol-disulfide isomerase/thioredoxin